jgi:hypothetical protein
MRLLSAIVMISAAALTTLQAGCSSMPELPPQARTGLTDISSSLAGAGKSLDSVVGSLRKLDGMRGDASALINEYTKNLASLERTVESTRARLSTVRGPESFFESWKKDIDSISDTQLRREGEDRYEATRRALSSLNGEIDSLRDSFAPMYKDMQDLGTFLKNDPTVSGIESAGESIRRILGQQRNVTSKLNGVQNAIKSLL